MRSTRVTVQEKLIVSNWLKKANVERSVIVSTSTTTMKPTRTSNATLFYETMKPLCRKGANSSFRHYNNSTVAPLAPVMMNMYFPQTTAGPSMAAPKENRLPHNFAFKSQNFTMNLTMTRSQEQSVMDMFNNCQVSFIFGSSKRAAAG